MKEIEIYGDYIQLDQFLKKRKYDFFWWRDRKFY